MKYEKQIRKISFQNFLYFITKLFVSKLCKKAEEVHII